MVAAEVEVLASKNCKLFTAMKKYFFYNLLSAVIGRGSAIYRIAFAIIIVFLGLVLNISQEIKNKIFENSFVQAQFDGGGGGGGFGGGQDGESDYDIDYEDGDCEAVYCYAGRNTQPCPDDAQIKENQKRIVDLRDVMLYFKNRALAERADLKEDIEKIINEKIKWYQDEVAAERQVFDQLPAGADKNLVGEIIKILEQDKTTLETEKNLKEQLREKLLELANAIEELPEPINELTPLPEQCLANVRERCFGICAVGCHDELECAPIACYGGNPCPTWEIENKVDDIRSVNDDIRRIADEIINIVSQIRQL